MEFRDPRYNNVGTIDVEINHPLYGWVPFTASPNDPSEVGRSPYAEVIVGDVAAYIPAVSPVTVDDYKSAIVVVLDTAAQERRYDNAVSISTYVSSTNTQWVAEASAFIAWRDAVWAYAYVELEKVMGGLRPQPTIDDFLKELPVMVWPAQSKD